MELDGEKGEFHHAAMLGESKTTKSKSSVYTWKGQTVYRGWKAIAKGLGVSVSTAKRMHEELGMPVIRVSSALAWTTIGAIDQWVIHVAGVERKLMAKMKAESDPDVLRPRNWRKRYLRQEKKNAGEEEGAGAGGGAEEGHPGDGGGAQERNESGDSPFSL